MTNLTINQQLHIDDTPLPQCHTLSQRQKQGPLQTMWVTLFSIQLYIKSIHCLVHKKHKNYDAGFERQSNLQFKHWYSFLWISTYPRLCRNISEIRQFSKEKCFSGKKRVILIVNADDNILDQCSLSIAWDRTELQS